MSIQRELHQALFALALFLFNLTTCLAQEKARTWSSSDEKFTVEAVLIEDRGETISLKRSSDGKLIKVPFAKLSVADQEYLASRSSSENHPTAADSAATAPAPTAPAPTVPVPTAPVPQKAGISRGSSGSSTIPTGLKAIKQALLEKSIEPAAGKFSLTTEKDFTPALNDAFAFGNRYRTLNFDIRSLEMEKEMVQAISGPKIERPRLPSSVPNLFPERNSAADAAKIERIDQAIETLRVARKKELSKFLTALAQARELADEISEAYSQVKQDDEVQSLIAAYNTHAGKSFALGTSTEFQTVLAKFGQLESVVKTETFPLSKEGDTMYVTVTVNEEEVEMIVDPSARYCVIHDKANRRSEFFTTPFDPEVTITKSDGGSLKGRLTNFGRVQLGRFGGQTKCLLLTPEFENEPARLGSNFLNDFNYELLDDETQLKLTTIGQIPQ